MKVSDLKKRAFVRANRFYIPFIVADEYPLWNLGPAISKDGNRFHSWVIGQTRQGKRVYSQDMASRLGLPDKEFLDALLTQEEMETQRRYEPLPGE